MPKPSYWQKYDLLYKKHSKKSLYKKLLVECKKLGIPYQKSDNRGRKPKFSAYEYSAFIALEKIFRHRYREMELEVELILGDKVDHSTLHRNYEKIPQEYIEKLIENLVNKRFIYWIADSTAISSKIRVERTRQGTRKKELLTDKYHIVAGYDPKFQEVQILGVKATDNHVSDSQGAIEILQDKKSNAYFLGDSAYNTYELHEVAKKAGLFPLLKPDKKGIRKTLSVKAKNIKLFCKNLYKEVRGIVETVFGGVTNAGLILSYAKKEQNRRKDTLMLALRHNLFANLRVLTKEFPTACRELVYLWLFCDKLVLFKNIIGVHENY
jgi:hypothetical protein